MKRRRRLWTASLLLGVLLAAATAGAASRYDPRLRFRTTSTPRFDIHFHQGEEALAARLAGFVEDAAAEVDAAVGAAVGRVQVILVDQHDISNGWATPLPYNTIEISAAAPAASEAIGNTDDWLRLVFVHEYTHIAHLSRAGGWIAGLRRGFGRMPLLFPNLYQPVWGIEGLATWQESRSTGLGRVPAGDFRLLVDQAAVVGRFEPIDRSGGGTLDWPSGTIPYVYGAYFHQYLSETYGAQSVARLVEETGRRLPYFGSRAYKAVYGRTLGQLWKDFSVDARRAVATPAADAVTQRTHHGFSVSGPRFGRDGRIFYSAMSPHHFPALMMLGSDGEPPQRIANKYLGEGIADTGEGLLVDAIEQVRSVGLVSDLYVIDPRTGASRRLTREARAQDPDVSREGVVVCTVQASDGRGLATMRLPATGPGLLETLVAEAGTDFAGPAWSPDGLSIAVERRRPGSRSEIVLVDPRTGSVTPLANVPDGRSSSPSWTPAGDRVLFSAAVGDAPFQIYSVDVASRAISRLEGTGPSAQSPEVSPDGRTLLFVGYTAAGHDLFSMPLESARWTPLGPGAVPAASNIGAARAAMLPAAGEPAPASRPYSPASSLLPQFWTPLVESDAGELVAGAATGSLDALGRHAYGVEAGWSTRRRPDWRVAYAYDRWRPTIFAAFGDDTDPWRGGEARIREIDAGLLLHVSRIRVSHRTLLAFHAAQETFSCTSCAEAVDLTGRWRSLRLGWELDASRSFGYSISAEEGGRFSISAELPRRAFGGDGNGTALTVEGRRYWKAWPRHGAVALRAAAASSWGDRDARRRFSAAGSGPRPGGFAFGLDSIGLLRGVDQDDLTGTRAAVLNLDYRAPIARVDRGVGTLPVFLRVLHGALFADAGHAWTGTFRTGDVRVSLGAELSADTVVGYALPLTFTAGAAWRQGGHQGDRGLAIFARVGRAF